MKLGALKIVFIYMLVGIVWITFSDKILFTHHSENISILLFLSSIKGFVFVIITAILLYFLIKAYTIKLEDANAKLTAINSPLLEQKKLLSEIQHIAQLGGWQYYLDTKKQVRSEGIFEILDFTYPEEPDPESNFIAHIHPDDKELYIRNRDLSEKDGIPTDCVLRIFDSAGQLHYFHRIAELEYVNGRPYRVSGSIQDITEIKMLEEEKNHYLIKLEDTLNSISDAFFLLNNEWIVTTVNNMFELVSGYKKELIVGKNFMDLWPHTKDSNYVNNFKKAFEEKTTVKFEEYSPALQKWLRLSCYPTSEGVAVYFTDITESKQKDIQLQEALERYNLAARATEDLLYEFDIVNSKIAYSQGYGHFSKLVMTYESDTSLKWFDLIHSEDFEKVIAARQSSLINKKHKYECEYRINVGNSKFRYVYDQAEFVYNEYGEAVKMIGAVRDIHELKTAGEENKRLGEIINKISNLVLITDEQKNVAWTNRAFTEFTGYKLREIKGKKPGSFLSGPNPDPFLAKTVTGKTANNEVFAMELPLYIKNQTILWVNADFTPLYNTDQQFTGYIIIYSDISAIKDKEAGLMKQNELLREIAWSGSHEVRKPLATLMGLINLLKAANNEQEKQQLFDYIDASTDELDTMLRKINDRINERTN